MASPDVVRDFYVALNDHDWERLAATMADDVVRIGFNQQDDTCRGKERYMEFVKAVIGRFEFHEMKILNIFYSADRRRAAAETVETIQPPGGEKTVLHCLKWIEINEQGLITSFNFFQKAPSNAPPDWIKVGAIERMEAEKKTVQKAR
jgi:hypothetical protein